MGIRFRKSLKLGMGLRINLSKSGIGYSWGIPGYRITKTARGTTRNTFTLRGTGISWVSETGKKKNKHKSQNNKPFNKIDSNVEKIDSTVGSFTDVESASIENFQDDDYNYLLKRMSVLTFFDKVSTVMIFLLIFPPFLIIGIIIKILLFTVFKVKLHYELDDFMTNKYNNSVKSWLILNKCNKLWQIIQSASVLDKKYHSGASELIKRIPIKFSCKKPVYLSCNIEPVRIKLLKETIFIFPDVILVSKGFKVGATRDNFDLKIDIRSTKFIDDVAPKDAKIIDYTWQTVNKDGSRDKRVKNNKRLPICEYGNIKISSASGLNIELYCSSLNVAKEFSDKITTPNIIQEDYISNIPDYAKEEHENTTEEQQEFLLGQNDIFKDNELSETETIFFQAVYDAVLESNNDPALLKLNRLSDKTINVQYIDKQIGRIKLSGRKTKMQILNKDTVEWVENESIENYIKNIDRWILCLKNG